MARRPWQWPGHAGAIGGGAAGRRHREEEEWCGAPFCSKGRHGAHRERPAVVADLAAVEAAWRGRTSRRRAWLPAWECLGKDHVRQRRMRLEENEEGRENRNTESSSWWEKWRQRPYRWAFVWGTMRRQPLARTAGAGGQRHNRDASLGYATDTRRGRGAERLPVGRPAATMHFFIIQIFFKLICIDSIKRLPSLAQTFPNKTWTCI
jgi:hypothetical protein